MQEFHISRIQSRNDMFETYIVVIHDQIPQIPIPRILPLLASVASRFVYIKPYLEAHKKGKEK